MTNQQKIILATRRLLLRQQALEDLEELWEFHRNPENIRYYLDAPRTLEEVREQLEWDVEWYQKEDRLGTWAVIQKETARIIGLCSLMPWIVNGIEEVEMAYILAEDCRGQGFGTELSQGVVQYAFGELNLSRIVSLIEPENVVSQHVVEKAGLRFEKEGQEETGSFLVYSIEKNSEDPA